MSAESLQLPNVGLRCGESNSFAAPLTDPKKAFGFTS